MKYKEILDRNGNLTGYWDELGAYAHPDSLYDTDEDGVKTLKGGVEIVPMSEKEKADQKATIAALEKEMADNAYKAKRAAEYPQITDYIDGVVKGDQAQIDKYIADCLAVKAKYPKTGGA